MSAFDDGPQQTQATAETVMRYHLCWKHRDLDGVMALYHPEIQYNDFFQNRTLGLDQLREYVASSMPRDADEALEHSDRIRVDGNTAFIQYQVTLRGGRGLVSFRASEAITVRDVYSEGQALEVILGVSLATLCNFANVFARHPARRRRARWRRLAIGAHA